jgi:hypothetical protein
MLFRPLIASDMSGSVGGLCFSRNKGGAYARIRAIPTNPNTPLQQAIRSFVAYLAAAWTNILDDDQRASWATYGANVLVPNRIGASIYLSGMQHFIRSNVPRLYVGGGILADAPEVMNLGEYTAPTATYSAATDKYSITFDNTDVWATEVGSKMLLYASRQQGPAINYFKGPYQFLGSISGADPVPPTSPAEIDAVFPLAEGNKGFLRANVIRLDGRLSLDCRFFCTAAA